MTMAERVRELETLLDSAREFLPEGLVVVDGRMRRKKGGGRESGDKTRTGGSTVESPGNPPAAANPAAEHRVVCVGHLCGTWHDVDPEAKLRALEAELADAKRSATLCHTREDAAEARVAELEAAFRSLYRSEMGRSVPGDFNVVVDAYAREREE